MKHLEIYISMENTVTKFGDIKIEKQKFYPT